MQTGYSYPALQSLIDGQSLKRLNENRVNLMFKALEHGMADRMVTSEAEIEGYFFDKPSARALFEISAAPLSVVPTQCAVSRKSRNSLANIDKALATLMKPGDIERMAKDYGLAMR